MENAVKYVHVDDASFKPALCFRGEKTAYAVIQDVDGVKTVPVDIKDFDKANPVMYHGEPYNTKAYADRLLMAAKAASRPVSRRARQLLVGLDTVTEDHLLPEEIEVENVTILSDRSPSERIKENRRPSAVRDVTEAYKAQEAIRAAQAALEVPPPPPPAADRKAALRGRKGIGKALGTPPKAPAAVRKTATAGRTAKPAPVEQPPPSKAPKTATKAADKAKPKYGGRGLVVARLAHELSTDPKSLRVRLRAAGLKAPYDDIAKMRKALK